MLGRSVCTGGEAEHFGSAFSLQSHILCVAPLRVKSSCNLVSGIISCLLRYLVERCTNSEISKCLVSAKTVDTKKWI